MDKIKKIGPIFIIIASLLWSLDGILRRSLYSLPPATIVFFEHALGLLIMTPFFIIPAIKELKHLSKKEWIAILVVSLFSGALGTIFYTSALAQVNYIQFSVVVLLQQLQPIWAISMAALLLKEKISKRFVLWAILAIVASYFVTFKDLRVNIAPGNGTLIAALLALLAGVMWGSTTSFSKIVLKKVSHNTATYLRFLFAPVFAFLFLLFFGQTASVFQVAVPQWTTLLLITFSTGMVALLIYYYGLKKTEGKVSAICELVWPASAIVIDYVYFKNTLSVTQILGTIVVLFSIYKVTTLKK
ncbi:DMT family transporter [Candidatus Roizmanbacteria bacterium]|nr:DMT family transporter [Candidatus Roizmanbacteria bacterium]